MNPHYKIKPKWWWLVVAIILLATMLNMLNDVLRMEWDGEDLTLAPGGGYGQSAMARYTYEDLQDAGPFTMGPGIPLEKGDYVLTVQYSNTTQGANRIEVFGTDAENEDGSLGHVFASVELPGGDTTLAKVKFTLPQTVYDVHFRTYYGGDGLFTVNKLFLESDGLHFYDSAWLLAVEILLLMGFLFFRKRHPLALQSISREKKMTALLFVCLALLVNYGLLKDFLVIGHDLSFHLIRMEGIKDGLLMGQFPVRISPTHFRGMGYATSTMYPELFLYPAAILRILGVSASNAYKCMLAGINIATMGVTYLCAKQLFRSRMSGLMTMVLYTLSMYRITNVYTRSAIGEACAMIFWPVLVLGLYEVFFRNERRWPLLVVGYSGIIQSHLISVEFAGLFSVFFGIVFFCCLVRKPQRFFALCKAAALTVLLNLWFLVPLLQMSASGVGVLGHQEDVQREGIYLSQLFFNWFPFQPENLLSKYAGTFYREMSFGLGFSLVLAVIGFVAGRLWQKDPMDEKTQTRWKIGCTLLGFSALSIWAASVHFPWRVLQRLPVIQNIVYSIQFPWRLLAIATPLLALVGGAAVLWLPKKKQQVAALCFAFFLSFVNSGYLIENTLYKEDTYTKFEVTQTQDGKYNEYLVGNFEGRAVKDSAMGGDYGAAKISNYKKEYLDITFDFDTKSDTQVMVPLIYYPQYCVKIDGQRVPFTITDSARIQFTLPAGSGSVSIYYEGSVLSKVATGISAVTLLGICVFAVRKRKKKTTTQEIAQHETTL